MAYETWSTTRLTHRTIREVYASIIVPNHVIGAYADSTAWIRYARTGIAARRDLCGSAGLEYHLGIWTCPEDGVEVSISSPYTSNTNLKVSFSGDLGNILVPSPLMRARKRLRKPKVWLMVPIPALQNTMIGGSWL